MKLVLLVEDEFGQAELMSALLQGEGYRVVTALNGEEALKCLHAEKPALILSDFMMPVMHGGELGKAVRRDPQLAEIPFVFMSGTSEHVVKQAFDQYDAFLSKPYDIDSLLVLVAKMIDDGRPSPPRSGDITKSMMHRFREADRIFGLGFSAPC